MKYFKWSTNLSSSTSVLNKIHSVAMHDVPGTRDPGVIALQIRYLTTPVLAITRQTV